QGDDVEAELVVRQRQAAFGLGAVRAAVAITGGVAAAADLQGQPGDPLQGREGAVVVVGGPGALPTGGAVLQGRGEGQSAPRLRARARSRHWFTSFRVCLLC